MYQIVPTGFCSTSEANSVYKEIRPQIIPILRAKARISSIAGYIDREDLLQEMEVSSLYAVSTHDPERGSMLHWVGVLANRTVSMFLRYAYKKSRAGTVYLDPTLTQEQAFEDYNDRGLRDYACFKRSEALIEDSAEDYWMQREADLEAQSRRARFRAAVDWQLDGFARDFFWARINPSVELLIFSRNSTGVIPDSPSQLSVKVIAEFFGVDLRVAFAARDEVERAVVASSKILEDAGEEA